jgi:putative nucleotidyltransferase with HDIG domain
VERYRDGMSLTGWAFDVAREKLEASPSRWAHVQGVARQARALRVIVGADSDLLEAAAILHDVGYALDLAITGFHPLDGAIYLAEIGAPARLVNLVAHHSYALLEAQLRGLADEMTNFSDERGAIRDALWYCDQTTSPFGEAVTPQVRMAEIQQRYGPDHIVSRFITEAASELLAAVQRTEERKAALTAG